MTYSLRQTLLFVLLLTAAVATGCQEVPETQPNADQDMRGVYAPLPHATWVIKLAIGDTVRAAKPSGIEGFSEFGALDGKDLLLDLTEFCGREEVFCPVELLPETFGIDQPEWALRLGTHGIEFTQHPIALDGFVVEGVVDHNDTDTFVLDLGKLPGAGDCQVLPGSSVRGRFTHSYETEEEGVVTWQAGERVDGIADGLVSLRYPGTCAFGAAGESFVMTLEHRFIAYRLGDLAGSDTPPVPSDVTSGDPEGDAPGSDALPDPSDVTSGDVEGDPPAPEDAGSTGGTFEPDAGSAAADAGGDAS